MGKLSGFKRSSKVEIGLGEVTVFGIKLVSIPTVLKTLVPAFEKISSIPSETRTSSDILICLTNVIVESHSEIFNFIEETTSMTIEQVKELDLDDSIVVLIEIYNLNKELFEKKILPLVASMQKEKVKT